MSDGRPVISSASINSLKITRFLLDPDHPQNKGRAKFFAEFGFARGQPHILAEALLRQPKVAHSFELQNGRLDERRIAFDGRIDTPDGRGAHVRTIWNYDKEGYINFITVVPLPRLK